MGRSDGRNTMTRKPPLANRQDAPADLPEEPPPLRVGTLVFTPGDPRVVAKGRVIYLSRQELVLLELLAQRKPVNTAALAQGLGRGKGPLSARGVAVNIYRLRARLRPGGMLIRTIRGAGYLLDVEEAT